MIKYKNNLTAVNSVDARRKKYNILFLCKDNTLLSIVAESILKQWSDGQFCSYSASIIPNIKLNSLTSRYLNNRGLSTSDLNCNLFNPSTPSMHFVIIVDKRISISNRCLLPGLLHGSPVFIDWSVSVPDKFENHKNWQYQFIQQSLSILEYRIRALSCIYMDAYSKNEQINRLNEIAVFYPEIEYHQYLSLAY
jgi:protein-tyrosine-phosphatase